MNCLFMIDSGAVVGIVFYTTLIGIATEWTGNIIRTFRESQTGILGIQMCTVTSVRYRKILVTIRTLGGIAVGRRSLRRGCICGSSIRGRSSLCISCGVNVIRPSLFLSNMIGIDCVKYSGEVIRRKAGKTGKK